MRFRSGCTFLPLVALFAGCDRAASPAPDITVRDGWVRRAELPATASGPGNSAAYMTIENHGTASDRLVAVEAGFARRAELHETKVDGRGLASMQPVDAVELPATGRVVLAPGGLHVMLIGIEASLAVGDTVPLTLRFERSGRHDTTMPVLELGSEPR